jgi:hypothetical protein
MNERSDENVLPMVTFAAGYTLPHKLNSQSIQLENRPVCGFVLLDPPHYLQPHPVPLLPDVVSFRFFTNTAEYFVRICIAFQEIAYDSPDILTRGTAPDRGLIQEVS